MYLLGASPPCRICLGIFLANFYHRRGHKTDYQRLKDLGVTLEGKIALVQYGPQLRGLKVKDAQAFGMIGCIIYSDPGDDGNTRIENGHLAYPAGPARNPSSVQRGSVAYFSVYVGDPVSQPAPVVCECHTNQF